ncbi:reverse transcriptase domain-containing protein [Tanacetum coccineum]
MKLNPKKCTFGVEEGMFLGYMVNTKGIKVCPDKVESLLSLPSLKCLKDVQRLNGKLASLNRFLAKSAEKSLPFIKTLKKCIKKSDFPWTTEAEAAFKQMKKLIAETAPIEKEELIIYLTAAREVVSAVLMTEKEAKQMPIYSVSRALQGRPVQSSSVVKPENAERLQKWSIALGRNDIHYKTRGYQSKEKTCRLIVEQPEDIPYAAKESWNNPILEKVKTLTNSFKKFSIKQVPRSENKKADTLSKIASTRFAHLTKQVLVEVLKEKAINEAEVLTVVEEEGNT